MADFLTAAASVWHILLLGGLVTIGALYADRRSDRKWRVELRREELARIAADHAHREDCRTQWRAGAATRRGQDTAKRPGRLRVVDGGQ